MHSSENISWFADITLKDRVAVGGKGGSLGELTRAEIAVPRGFVVRTAAFEKFLGALEREDAVRSRVEVLGDHELEQITNLSKQLRARIEDSPLLADLQSEILRAHAELCADQPDGPLAEDASFAGLQDTYLWVMGAQATLKNVRSCWASLYSVPSISYRRKRNMPEAGVAMAVVVQQMVDARTAGVMFTRSPLTGDRSVITIEGTWGLGSAVVSGEVTPDRFVIAKITGEISVRDISDKHIQHVPATAGGVDEVETPDHLRREACLTDAELAELKEIARKVERHYGRPQDIEWAIDRDGKIFLLQSRPETVWSSKEAIPVARPAENPLTHVMNIFGGRR
jgi:pyruvate, water dikinase